MVPTETSALGININFSFDNIAKSNSNLGCNSCATNVYRNCTNRSPSLAATASRTRSAPRLSKFVFAPTLPRFSAPPSLFSTPNCTFFSGRNKCQFAAHKHSRSNLCTATMLDRGQESQSDVSFFPGSGAKVVSRPPQRQSLR